MSAADDLIHGMCGSCHLHLTWPWRHGRLEQAMCPGCGGPLAPVDPQRPLMATTMLPTFPPGAAIPPPRVRGWSGC
jgi:hypothetical protein